MVTFSFAKGGDDGWAHCWHEVCPWLPIGATVRAFHGRIVPEVANLSKNVGKGGKRGKGRERNAVFRDKLQEFSRLAWNFKEGWDAVLWIGPWGESHGYHQEPLRGSGRLETGAPEFRSTTNNASDAEVRF